MRTTAAPLLIGVFLLTACGGSDLEANDPAGYEACRLYVESVESDDPLVRLGLPMFEIGGHASEAETEAIREAVEPFWAAEAERAAAENAHELPEAWIVDHDAMAAACEANGVEVPS